MSAYRDLPFSRWQRSLRFSTEIRWYDLFSFGLRLTLFTIGSVVGSLIATGIMLGSGGDIRLVFWIAVIPAFLSLAVLIMAVKEPANAQVTAERRFSLRDLSQLPAFFWWVVAITAMLELARFSQAFLLLKAKEVG